MPLNVYVGMPLSVNAGMQGMTNGYFGLRPMIRAGRAIRQAAHIKIK